MEWKAGIARVYILYKCHAGEKGALANRVVKAFRVLEHGQTYYAGRLSDNVFLIAGGGYTLPTPGSRGKSRGGYYVPLPG